MKTLNSLCTVLCLFFAMNLAQAQLEWVTYRGTAPGNTVIGGSEGNRQLPVCRCEFKGNMTPGKVVDRRCNISYGGKEHILDNFQVLTKKGDVKFSWQAVKKGDPMPKGAFIGGQEGINKLYVGRMKYVTNGQNRGTHPGKVVHMRSGFYNIYTGYGGKEIESSSFEVLVVEMSTENVFRVGDKHPCGGTVISISNGGKSGVIAAEEDIYAENIYKTKEAVSALGAGWALPNEHTMGLMAKQVDKLGLKLAWYWTGNQVSNGYWASLNIADGGKVGNRFSGEKQYCRPIMSFDENTKCKKPAQEVAKGKKARQSSTKYDQNGAASNAVDGNKNGNWSWNSNSLTHTQDEKDAWWEVDLGAVYDVSKIEIWNRRDCCWDRLKNFYVMVSEGPISSNSTTNNQFVSGANSFTTGDHPSMILEGNKRGRYVRIFLKADNMPLTLAEVEVYGSPVR
ncbi:MAG: DM9 repeat-containing protein [Bacteroidota bacterium]